MQISSRGIALIQEFEGCELTAYQDSVGVWTIGYGHASGVKSGQTITQERANELLKQDLELFEGEVNSLVKVEITQSQFDALTAFTFNVGTGAFSSSTLLDLLNKRHHASAGDQLLRWNKAGGEVLAGLTRRRQAERRLFYREPFPVAR